METILVIEDDTELNSAISRVLRKKYRVIQAHDGGTGLAEARKENPNLILLDLNLPDDDGVKICHKLKEGRETSDIPVLIVSGRSDLEERINVLMAGANDYLGKPFDMGELNARVHVQMRQRQPQAAPRDQIRIVNLVVDLKTARASVDGCELPLTHFEFRMLVYFARRKGELVTRKQMLTDLWQDTVVSGRTIDTHVVSLRKKLKHFSGGIETVYGGGYRLVEATAAEKGKTDRGRLEEWEATAEVGT
jgi:DNA-binding response OmpR family regulator